MDWNAIGQGVATGLGAAVPLGVGVAWVILKAFNLGRWKEKLATKEDMEAHRAATKRDMEAHRAATKRDMEALSARIQDTREEVAELKSTVASLASTVASLATTVEATRSDVGRIVEHLLSSKQE